MKLFFHIATLLALVAAIAVLVVYAPEMHLLLFALAPIIIPLMAEMAYEIGEEAQRLWQNRHRRPFIAIEDHPVLAEDTKW